MINPTTPKEMATDKMYYFDAASGYSLGSNYDELSLTDLAVTKNSLQFIGTSTDSNMKLSGYGIAVPVDLESGKQYTFGASRVNTEGYIRLIKFAKNEDMWTYESWEELITGSALTCSKTFTAEAEKGYAFLFAIKSGMGGTVTEFTNISLVESK